MHCNAPQRHPMRNPDLKISGKRFNLMKLPCVYAWLRGDEWMYVGVSTRGISRPLAYGHHAMSDFLDEDVLLIWRFRKEKSALDFEQELIKEKQPAKNVAGIEGDLAKARKSNYNRHQCERCGADFYTRTKWQRYCSPICRFKDWNENHPRKSEQVVISVND